MATHLISDEDWAIISSSSSDYDEESTTSSFINLNLNPVSEASSGPINSLREAVLNSESLTVSDGSATTADEMKDFQNDSITTVRPRKQEEPLEHTTSAEGIPVSISSCDVTHKALCSNVKPNRTCVDSRIRQYSKSLFVSLFGRCKPNAQTIGSSAVSSECLGRQMMHSMYLSMERYQEHMIYIFLFALCSGILALQYGPGLFLTLKTFALDKMWQRIWTAKPLKAPSRLGLVKEWIGHKYGSRPDRTGGHSISRSLGLPVMTDMKYKLVEKLEQVRVSTSSFKYDLDQKVKAYTKSFGLHVGFGLDRGMNHVGKPIDVEKVLVKTYWDRLLRAVNSESSKVYVFVQNCLSSILRKVPTAPRKDTQDEIVAKVSNSAYKMISDVSVMFHEYGSLLKSLMRKNVQSIYVGNKQAISCAGENTFLAKMFHQPYRFSKEALSATFDHIHNYSVHFAQPVLRSKQVIDSFSRRTYQFVWADNNLLRQWRH